MNQSNVQELIRGWTNECADDPCIYRGTSQIHDKISSSLYRVYEDENIWKEFFLPINVEKDIVEKAKKHFPHNTANIEILTDLRHYGGKVNLIDFSRDLYVALFFACNNVNEAGELIMLKSDQGCIHPLDIDYSDLDPGIRIIEPAHTSVSQKRVVAQKSIFAYAPQGYIEKCKCKILLIEKENKQAILEYLRKYHDIHTDSIYNDLIGFIENEDNYRSAETEFYRGNAKCTLGQYTEAIRDYDQAITLKPDLAEAWYNRGNSKRTLGQYTEAIRDYDQAITLKPDYAEAWNNRGDTKSTLGQYTEAIRDYDQAITLKPDYAKAWNNRGNAKCILGQDTEAIRDYDQAITLKPDLAEAWNNRGHTKCILGQDTEAIRDYDQAITLKPDYAKAYYNRGIINARLGFKTDSKLDLKTALRLAHSSNFVEMVNMIEQKIGELTNDASD